MTDDLHEEDLHEIASEAGQCLANIIVASTRVVSTDAHHLMLDRAAEQFAHALVERGVSDPEIVEALETFADAFEARLTALDRALHDHGGRA